MLAFLSSIIYFNNRILFLICAYLMVNLLWNWQCRRKALSLINRDNLRLIFRNNFSNPAGPSSDLIGHPFIRVENFNFKKVSDYSAPMVDHLQTESWCLLCNSLLLKIDLIDRFCVGIWNASLLAGLFNRHPLLVDEADELFSLFVRHLYVVVLFCHG